MKKEREITLKTDYKWLNIKEVVEPSKGVKGFLFAERVGVDSVAFIGYNKDEKKYILTREYLPPIGKFGIRAFGGSLDKEIDKIDIVKEEISEEAGYSVSKSDIFFIGKYFVSSMMNQFCFLYFFTCDNSMKIERTTTDEIEKLSEVVLLNKEDIYSLSDWKSIVILSRIIAR